VYDFEVGEGEILYCNDIAKEAAYDCTRTLVDWDAVEESGSRGRRRMIEWLVLVRAAWRDSANASLSGLLSLTSHVGTFSFRLRRHTHISSRCSQHGSGNCQMERRLRLMKCHCASSAPPRPRPGVYVQHFALSETDSTSPTISPADPTSTAHPCSACRMVRKTSERLARPGADPCRIRSSSSLPTIQHPAMHLARDVSILPRPPLHLHPVPHATRNDAQRLVA